MQSHEYERMHQYEDRYWWYAGFRRILAFMFQRFVPRIETVLDAGCGTGGNLTYLAKILSPAKTFAIDINEQALQLTETRKTGVVLAQASVSQIPFQENAFDVITCLDVICTRGVNDLETLGEFHRVLKPGGFLFINLPAFKNLAGAHDHAVQIAHRYDSAEVSDKLKSIGFEIKRLTYWNALLFPFLFVWRKWTGLNQHPGMNRSDFRTLPVWINEGLKFLLRIEQVLISSFNLPFGSSIFAVAQKPLS